MLSSPVKFLCLSPSIQLNEGKLETKAPISQAIRLLFCVLCSSFESHTNSYSSLFHLSFALHLLFHFFFPPPSSSGATFRVKSHLAEIFAVMRFFLLDTIYNSLFCFCSSFAIYRPSFIFPFVRLSISLSLSAEACLIIHQVCVCDQSAHQSHLSLQSFILIKCFWVFFPCITVFCQTHF